MNRDNGQEQTRYKGMQLQTQDEDVQAKIIREFCESLKNVEKRSTGVAEQLATLINQMPTFGRNSDCMKGYYSKLANIYVRYLSNNEKIKPPPDEGGFMCHIQYTYDGNYSGYRDVFCGNIGADEVAEYVRLGMEQASTDINGSFWGRYAVTLVTDAITREAGEISVNRTKLDEDLNGNHSILSKGAAAGYIRHYAKGYEPARSQIEKIERDGMKDSCLLLLEKALPKNEALIANINQLIAQGGENTAIGQWIIFGFCVILEALGSKSASGVINLCMGEGLAVPSIMQGDNWRNGTYTDWFFPICGSDLRSQLKEVRGSMPVKKWSRFGMQYVGYPLGYALSFCRWGKMAWY